MTRSINGVFLTTGIESRQKWLVPWVDGENQECFDGHGGGPENAEKKNLCEFGVSAADYFCWLMSKRRKKNRHAKLPMSAVAKPRYRVVAAIFLAALIVLSLGIWWWKFKSVDTSSTQNSTALANPAASASNSEFEKLKGRWQRPDGGYVLEIKSIATNGSMDAGYFNPRSIHVVKAEALRDADATKVFIELRDVNYPGSNYSPTYEPASDQLKGIYYQAVEQQRFAVVFMRV